LLDDYEFEYMAAHGYETADNVSITTRYMETEEERTPYKVSVGEGGKLFQGGQLLDTEAGSARTGIRAAGSAGGHLYAMSPQGQIYSADMASEWEKGGMQGPAATVKKVKGTYQSADPGAESAEATTFHHSSFLAGGDVAGAGEIRAHEGILSMISNASGHYRPGPEYVMQTLNQLEAGGAATDQARVRLMGDLTAQGYDASKEVTAAVGEFKQTGGSRDELLKRHRVLGELRSLFDPNDEGIQPENEEMKEAHQEVFTKLGRQKPYQKAFRDAKRNDVEGDNPLGYGDFMKRATGRDTRPKPKKPFSFSSALELPAAPPTAAPAPSIAPSRQSYKAYEESSDSGSASTLAPSIAPAASSPQLTISPATPYIPPARPPLAYTAYSSQTEEAQEVEIPTSSSTVSSAYMIDIRDEDTALPPGYVSEEEATA
jgi:hypothetical protein